MNTNTDNMLLKLAGDKAIEKGDCTAINTEEILNSIAAKGVSRSDFYESLAILDRRNYLKLDPTMGGEPSEPELRELIGGGVSDFSITVRGFEHYAQEYIRNYKSIVGDVQRQIVNDDQRDSASIAETLQQQQVVVDHVIDVSSG